MELSHSKLTCMMNNPADYYLNYVQGIDLIDRPDALSIGSAVHWGLEHGTSDLSEFWEKEKKNKIDYTDDELISECMVEGYLKHKDEIFDSILTYKGEKLNICSETHEITLTSLLASQKHVKFHSFLGIIDLLLVTEKGLILIDYKTSSREPDWEKYLDQIYRYIFLLRDNFPEFPILKIGIINLKKPTIRKRKNENDEEYRNRMRIDYDLNENNEVCFHEYPVEDLDEGKIKSYIYNLSLQADFAEYISKMKKFPINYSNIVGIYGKTKYYDIYNHTEGCYVKYKIKDIVIDELGKAVKGERPCNDVDMMVMDRDNIINHYSDFKKIMKKNKISKKNDFEEVRSKLAENYLFDDNLLSNYWKMFTQKGLTSIN